RDAGTLRADRFLGHLDEQTLALRDQLVDRRKLAVAIVAVLVVLVGRTLGDVGHAEERGLLGTEVHGCGLAAWQNGLHPPHGDGPDHALGIGPVDHQFNENVVFENGDARFQQRRGDEDLSFHVVVPAAAGSSEAVTSRSMLLAMTIRCTSLVPSPISQILSSRTLRSTGYSEV